MKAELKNYRQSPRKVRVVADMVRGKKVSDALRDLGFLVKRATGPLAKLISSAESNARQAGIMGELFIRDIAVLKGVTLKRIHPVSRGRAHRINKRSSHVRVTLDAK